jgi:hypothetical protein
MTSFAPSGLFALPVYAWGSQKTLTAGYVLAAAPRLCRIYRFPIEF